MAVIQLPGFLIKPLNRRTGINPTVIIKTKTKRKQEYIGRKIISGKHF
jgi:hypothetical protein